MWLSDEDHAREEIAQLEAQLRRSERARGEGRVRDEAGVQRHESELRAEIDRLRDEHLSDEDEDDREAA